MGCDVLLILEDEHCLAGERGSEGPVPLEPETVVEAGRPQEHLVSCAVSNVGQGDRVAMRPPWPERTGGRTRVIGAREYRARAPPRDGSVGVGVAEHADVCLDGVVPEPTGALPQSIEDERAPRREGAQLEIE